MFFGNHSGLALLYIFLCLSRFTWELFFNFKTTWNAELEIFKPI